MKNETIEFGKLPEKVQEFINRITPNIYSKSTLIIFGSLTELDWRLATDAERLAYCEVRYKEGMTVLSNLTKRNNVINSYKFRFGTYEKKYIYANDGYIELYNPETGKFAEIISDEVKEPSIKEKEPSIKEKLKGTCVLNESVEMGAEIVKLYTEAGFENKFGHDGRYIKEYYGEKHGDLYVFEKKCKFTSVLTLDQLRSIVRGEKAIHEGEKQPYFIDDLVPNRNYIYHGNDRDMVKGNTYFVYKANPDYIELLDAYGNPHQFIRSEWPLFELVKAESVEFKEGEIVEWRTSQKGDKWGVAEYHGKNRFGLHVISENTVACCVEEIRKIDTDHHGFLKTANEIISERIQHKPFDEDSVRDMLIEAMKRVKK